MKALHLIIGIGAIVIMWLLVGIGLSSLLANMIPFENSTPEEFISTYRTASLAVAIVSIILFAIWFLIGSKKDTALNLKGAKNKWLLLFVLSIVITLVQVIFMVFKTQNEGATIIHILLFFVGASLVGWISFWVTSFLWSPNNVKYCVLGKK